MLWQLTIREDVFGIDYGPYLIQRIRTPALTPLSKFTLIEQSQVNDSEAWLIYFVALQSKRVDLYDRCLPSCHV